LPSGRFTEIVATADLVDLENQTAPGSYITVPLMRAAADLMSKIFS